MYRLQLGTTFQWGVKSELKNFVAVVRLRGTETIVFVVFRDAFKVVVGNSSLTRRADR